MSSKAIVARPASDKQRAFIARLLGERDFVISAEELQAAHDDSWNASRLIDRLLRAARIAAPDAAVEPGFYQVADDIFKVQKSKQSGNLYAKRLVEINGQRLRDADDAVVKFEFQYEPGAIRHLRADALLTEDQARAFGIRYGICCICTAPLKDAESVARGIGPICNRRFQ